MTNRETADAPPLPGMPSATQATAASALGLRARRPKGQLRITAYGCDADERALFRRIGAEIGIEMIITDEPLSGANIELAEGQSHVSVGHKTDITNAQLLALHQVGVRYISTRSIGYDHIDIAYAEGLGIRVEGVSYSPGSVADYTLMLMLMSLRHAVATLIRTSRGDYRLGRARGRELGDLTVGVIGVGRIGTAVIDRLRGFGCRVLAHDSRRNSGAHFVDLDELLAQCDVVTLHAPLTRDTHHLLSAERIADMKTGAVVINTARGGLVDTDSLLRALEGGQLGGAALDVLEDEHSLFYADHSNHPLETERFRRLQQLPNVIISPHTAYYTDHALADIVENSLLNCLRYQEEKNV
jgi:D-specific alpha-keto acid dehydrogenase